VNAVFDHYNFQVFIHLLAQTDHKMTSVEVPVTLEAPPIPKIAKRKVKAAEKAEKVHKKIAKSKSKGRKF